MFRRVWYYLRDLVWTAIVAALFIIIAIVAVLLFQAVTIALIFAVCSVALAILSTRS